MEDSRVHYDAVRRALANGNAAIMIGAGFSRNAENGDQLATWPEVAKELSRELNPEQNHAKDFSTSMVAQLGEQYARVFSKPALEDLLKRLIPDDRVSPGVLHRKLLMLPWCEVFTTNYDTLIERASESVVDHAHYVVTCREDIPQSKMLNRRRIVKLHGSFPSQRPFIFTEEDYRRYPDLSAPFVNLVRQSILENIFCLIGFSGDDPNFLHWIGWVRDVLDEHALPIYLFLGRAPTLGQKKLLESRKVTPVVLPMLEGVEESDYASRYNELLRILKEPLNPDHNSWGAYSSKARSMTYQSSDEEKWKTIVGYYLEVRELRDSYPGWFVAPREVRRRFASAISRISGFLHSTSLQDYVVEVAPHVGIAVMAEYSWHNEILLRCFDDGLAEFSMRLLGVTSRSSHKSAETERQDMLAFALLAQSSFDERQKELSISLVRWARQALRKLEFAKLSEQLLVCFPNDLHLKDELIYEDVLLALYKGDRDVAEEILKNWDIKSPDGYMFVRKGMLLGEVGDVSLGLTTSLIGLKKIRKNQRSRSGSVYYLSQEAWACQAIGYLQETLAWPNRFNKVEREQQFEINADELNQRLADLATMNHDVVQELQLLIADLNSEAPAPSQPVNRTPLFDLGCYSTTRHVGRSSSLDKKIKAAFAWLSLSDRVSLVPRVGDTTFDIGTFGQAAWWVQYEDSMERVLSVMIRTLNKKMLEPRNDNQLLHSAGWLSRYQVARVNESLAMSICEQSLSLVDRIFDTFNEDKELVRVASFHLEVVGRLIIRLADSKVVLSFAERIVLLHHNRIVRRYGEVWKGLAISLARCFENLSQLDRRVLSGSIALIPSVAHDGLVSDFYLNDWVVYHNLSKGLNDQVFAEVDDNIVKEVSDLLILLKSAWIDGDEASDRLYSRAICVWQRLFWLKEWGFINESQTQEICEFLSAQRQWPKIPGHHNWASLVWMPNAGTTQRRDFKNWLLDQELTCFRVIDTVGGSNVGERTTWRMAEADEYFTDLIASMDKSSWSIKDFTRMFFVVKKWWDSEWVLISRDASRSSDFKEMVFGRLSCLDLMVSKFIDKHGYAAFLRLSEIDSWFSVVRKEGLSFGAEFLRSRISAAFSSSDYKDLDLVEREVINGLLSVDARKIAHVVAVTMYWALHPCAKKHIIPVGIVRAVIGVISTRRMPALPQVLKVMGKIVSRQRAWLGNVEYGMLGVGLRMMFDELGYESRPDGTGIPDEVVPELRFGCLELAEALCETEQEEFREGADLWVGETISDPMPEFRYFRS